MTGGLAALTCIGALLLSWPKKLDSSLLHVSFDATREVLLEIADSFERKMVQDGQSVTSLIHSHGSSGSQARAVVAGLPADLVSLAVWPDLETIVIQGASGLVDQAWLDAASPWYTTMVFVVRKGNPKNIHSWEDLDKQDVRVIIPNPKVSGNGKLAFLAMLGASKTIGKTPQETMAYLKNIFSRVPVLESSSRAATLSFATKGLGDVQITYESEAELVLKEGMELEKIVPDKSIKAPLPLVPVNRDGQTAFQRKLIKQYLDYFSSTEAQEILVKHGFRPTNETVRERHSQKFLKPSRFFTVEEVAGSWSLANKDLFSQGGLFDKVMAP